MSLIINNPKIELIESDIVINELIEGFDPEKNFNDEEYFFGNCFLKHVFNPIKDEIIINIPEIKISRYVFTKKITDRNIMKCFGISKKTGLINRATALWLLHNISQKGIISGDIYTTVIGYLLCDDNIIRRVDVCYFDSKWTCYCDELEYLESNHGAISID